MAGPAQVTGEPERLASQLRGWLGAWPPGQPTHVVGSPTRDRPGWDGSVHPLVGVGRPDGLVLSVPPERVGAVRAAVAEGGPTSPTVAAALGRPDLAVFRGVFRWTTRPADLPDLGRWEPVDAPGVPEWLAVFGPLVLLARGPDGEVLAGLGLKRHHGGAEEVSVGTDPRVRGRGLARRLVATAARQVLERGVVPLYLHDPANAASAAVAEAAGFPERGWSVYGLFDSRP